MICQNGGTVATTTDSCLCAEPYYGDRCEKIMRGVLDGVFFININLVYFLPQPACFLSRLKKKEKKRLLCGFVLWPSQKSVQAW